MIPAAAALEIVEEFLGLFPKPAPHTRTGELAHRIARIQLVLSKLRGRARKRTGERRAHLLDLIAGFEAQVVTLSAELDHARAVERATVQDGPANG